MPRFPTASKVPTPRERVHVCSRPFSFPRPPSRPMPRPRCISAVHPAPPKFRSRPSYCPHTTYPTVLLFFLRPSCTGVFFSLPHRIILRPHISVTVHVHTIPCIGPSTCTYYYSDPYHTLYMSPCLMPLISASFLAFEPMPDEPVRSRATMTAGRWGGASRYARAVTRIDRAWECEVHVGTCDGFGAEGTLPPIGRLRSLVQQRHDVMAHADIKPLVAGGEGACARGSCNAC